MVFPGAPCIYYGTEVCMEGGYDPDSRRCFPWNEKEWDHELLAKVKELIALRKSKEIAYGSVHIDEKDGMLCVERKLGDKAIVAQTNMSENENVLECTESSEKGSIRLWINLSEKAVELPEKVDTTILAANLLEGRKINQNGFVVVRES